MVRSMTGFGRGVSTSEKVKITVEARAVNHRFLEATVKYPKELVELEAAVKKCVSRFIARGKVDVYIAVDYLQRTNKEVQVNWSLFHAYERVKKEVADTSSIATEWTMAEMLAIDDLLIVEQQLLPTEEFEQVVQAAVTEAMEQLVKMREREGEELHAVMLQLTNRLQEQLKIVESYSGDAVKKYRERLQQRLAEFTQTDTIDEKIVQEVAIFAEKIDITEELDRLNSHIAQLFDTIQGHGAIGRKIEFIVQELHRELNTIGSKNHSAACSSAIVEGKLILEKLREQVQNIE